MYICTAYVCSSLHFISLDFCMHRPYASEQWAYTRMQYIYCTVGWVYEHLICQSAYLHVAT